jgi:hypothetical protein
VGLILWLHRSQELPAGPRFVLGHVQEEGTEANGYSRGEPRIDVLDPGTGVEQPVGECDPEKYGKDSANAEGGFTQQGNPPDPLGTFRTPYGFATGRKLRR